MVGVAIIDCTPSRAFDFPLTSKSITDLLRLSTDPGWGSSDIWWVSAGVIEALRP